MKSKAIISLPSNQILLLQYAIKCSERLYDLGSATEKQLHPFAEFLGYNHIELLNATKKSQVTIHRHYVPKVRKVLNLLLLAADKSDIANVVLNYKALRNGVIHNTILEFGKIVGDNFPESILSGDWDCGKKAEVQKVRKEVVRKVKEKKAVTTLDDLGDDDALFTI